MFMALTIAPSLVCADCRAAFPSAASRDCRSNHVAAQTLQTISAAPLHAAKGTPITPAARSRRVTHLLLLHTKYRSVVIGAA
jgi:hypothetical protein